MAPTLRNGVVRGHHKQSYPAAQKFCRCNQCTTNWEVEPGSNRLVVGRYLGITEWNRHRAQELREDIITTHVSMIPLDLAPPTISFPTVPNLFSISPPTPPIPASVSSTPLSSTPAPSDENLSTPSPRARKTKSRAKPNIDPFTPKFRQIQSSLRSTPIDEIRALISKSPLVFVNPPISKVPAPPFDASLYALQPDALQNLTLLGREEWLEESQRFVKTNAPNIPKAKVGLRLLATTLTKQIEKELRVLHGERRLEWERQRKSGIKAGKDAIDTSE